MQGVPNLKHLHVFVSVKDRHKYIICYILLSSGPFHGALEEATDATELCLGPDWLWRRGGGESKPHFHISPFLFLAIVKNVISQSKKKKKYLSKFLLAAALP